MSKLICGNCNFRCRKKHYMENHRRSCKINNNDINLIDIFNKLYDYVIIKFDSDLPLYKKNDDIDILTSDMNKNKNIIISLYDKSIFRHKISIINKFQIHLDLIKLNEKKLTLRFDFYEKCFFKKFSLDDSIYKLILLNKIHNGIAYVPNLNDDLSLRYCEYIEHIDVRKDKIKHLNYVNNFDINFYKIKEGEINSKLQYQNTNVIFNSIIVWGHGIKYIQDIIHNLMNDIDCHILNIKKFNIDNINNLISKIYKLEMVNSNHIKAKTQYLNSIEKEYIHILIKNYGSNLKEYGSGNFKVIADENLVNWKWKIRAKYNPKFSNIKKRKKPLPVGISHNHVIHVTDSNNECEYLSNELLGNKPSFYEDRLFKNIFIPWHIPNPKKIKIDFIDIDNVKQKYNKII